MDIVVFHKQGVFRLQRTDIRCCTPGSKYMDPTCTGCRTLCNSKCCSLSSYGLENILGYPVNWRKISECEPEETRVYLVLDSKVYKVEIRGRGCKGCSLMRSSVCQDYCSSTKVQPLCNTLATILGNDSGIFVEVK